MRCGWGGPVGRVSLLWPTLAGGCLGSLMLLREGGGGFACSVAAANGADEGTPGPPTLRCVVLFATKCIAAYSYSTRASGPFCLQLLSSTAPQHLAPRRVAWRAGAGRTRGCHRAGAPTTALTQQPWQPKQARPRSEPGERLPRRPPSAVLRAPQKSASSGIR